ncbi:hypothetical protein [Neobacillus kokaensis]|uniref:Uncharacterized protein n=1 Tax=Neobacillus kokaensis TaxID=2759023 RepID=A0ABQ3N873_9BACI|nr:hypothetical protein [Neobacillus kokaensis]GHI00400.1 hypothetical protein AM1BK_39420 [Neobacillus kokaensis]
MRKKKKSGEESVLPALGMLILAFGAVLFFGWFVMTAHMDSVQYRDVLELALPEPYYTWIEKVTKIYWTVGVSAVVTIFFIVFVEDKLKHSDQLMFIAYTTLLWLLGSSMMIGFFVALIKLHAVNWMLITACLLVISLILNSTAILLKLKSSSKIITISFLVIESVIFLALFSAQPTDELYIIVKSSHQFSNFESKLLLWLGASLGLFIFTLPFYWKLRERWEDSTSS